MSEYTSFEHDGITVESNSADADTLRAAFDLPAEAPPADDEHEEKPPPKPNGAPAPEPESDDQAPDSKARDAFGRFAKKDSPARNPEKRIDQVIARQRAAEEQRDAAAKERDELRQRLQALEARTSAPPPPSATPPAPQPAPPADRFPDFQAWADQRIAKKEDASYESYLDERQDWRWQRNDGQARQAARQQDIAQAHQARLKQAREQIPDFDKQVNGDLPVTADVRDAMLESPLSPLLMLHFSKYPDDLQRYASLSAAQVHREIGRLESWLMTGARRPQATTGAVSAPVPSQAKPPGKPVGSSAPAPDPTEQSDDLPVEEWIRRGNARERAGRR